ncbi:MAG: tetratricopeptide repeat protein [Bacteroidota bacterium]
MAKSRTPKNNDDLLLDVTEVSEKAGSFVEENQTLLIGIAGLVVAIVAGFIAFNMLYKAPREKAAMEQMFKAEYQFQRDSFALALENPGAGYDGFLDIIDNYGGTDAANLAKYYAGVSYLNLNRFEDAISFLKSYKAKGKVTPITKWGAIGDAESELGNMESAIDAYRKATTTRNSALTPYYLDKLGLLLQRQGDSAGALAAFERIKKEYPKSTEAADVEKYLAMLK